MRSLESRDLEEAFKCKCPEVTNALVDTTSANSGGQRLWQMLASNTSLRAEQLEHECRQAKCYRRLHNEQRFQSDWNQTGEQ